jgi:trigger factor
MAMKTNVESVSGVEKRVRVVFGPDEVAKRVEEGYLEVRKMIPIRGFRKGKAPMSMVRRLFKEHVESDVTEHLVKESLSEAVRENDLKVLSPPKVDGGKVVEGEEFSFTATFEVLPEIVPVGYKGLEVVKEKVEVTEEKVDAALTDLRESFARFHAVEGRGAALGDLVEMTFTSSAGGEPIEADQKSSLIVGAGGPFGKEFEEKLIGAKEGDDKAFAVTYPAGDARARYAGKTIDFAVRVAAVREKRVPEADEEFVKNFSDIGSMEELRGKLRERLVAEGQSRSKMRLEEDIRQKLLENNAFPVPGSLVDRQIVRMIEDTANRLVSQGVDLKKVHMDFEKMKERFAANAERTVRAALLLAEIGKAESIDVSFGEIEAEMKEMASDAQMDYEKVREIYGDEERLDALRNRLLERKVTAFLVENAKVREEVSSE